VLSGLIDRAGLRGADRHDVGVRHRATAHRVSADLLLLALLRGRGLWLSAINVQFAM
jgi:hypothetical protein